ncbi:MAG: CDP-alcohol phosphatidyltransferase family protein [Nitrospina sp.]|nr:CDP-alcohol phosphatidyltransferase family protein [Nitrospina sp.]
MSEDTASSGESKMLTAILLLPNESHRQSRHLAGVPFLLRNALTLQKVGIKNLRIWMQDPTERERGNLNTLMQDSRIELEIEWTDRPPSTQALVLDGSTLLEKSKILQAMTLSTDDQVDISRFHYFPEALQQLSESQKSDLLKIVPPDDSSRLTHEDDFLIAEKNLLKSVGLSNDSMMDKLATRFISRQLTRLFLKTPITPNQITFLSLLIGLGAAWCFFQGTYTSGLAGAIMLLVSAWVDCTDGEIARLKFMETPWGARFDIFCDNIVHFFVFFSIGMGLFFSTGDPLYKLYGGLAVYGSLVSFVILGGIIIKKKNEAGQGKTSENSLTDQVANRDFIYFLLFMAIIDKLDIFILVTAIGANIFALYLMYQKWGRAK